MQRLKRVLTRLRAPGRMLRALSGDQRGQATVEWMLILVAFSLPMVWVIRRLLAVLAEHYRMVAFLETLPFP